jgi:hypothetical protein
LRRIDVRPYRLLFLYRPCALLTAGLRQSSRTKENLRKRRVPTATAQDQFCEARKGVMSETTCNRRLTLWLKPGWSGLKARRVSCFIPSRDPGRGEDLCSPGRRTRSWRRAFSRVQRTWRTCRLGGKTADRQHLNSTENGRFSQVAGRGLWIFNAFVNNGL